MMRADDLGLLAEINETGVLQPNLRASAGQLYGTQARRKHLWVLVDQGLVSARVVLRAPRCPDCQCYEMLANEACPRCGCANVVSRALYHHIPCAGIFEAAEGIDRVAVCPKCRECLTDARDRIETAGQMYHCCDCNERFPEPVLAFWCLICDHSHALKAVEFHRLHAFGLTAAGKAALAAQRHG